MVQRHDSSQPGAECDDVHRVTATDDSDLKSGDYVAIGAGLIARSTTTGVTDTNNRYAKEGVVKPLTQRVVGNADLIGSDGVERYG